MKRRELERWIHFLDKSLESDQIRQAFHSHYIQLVKVEMSKSLDNDEIKVIMKRLVQRFMAFVRPKLGPSSSG